MTECIVIEIETLVVQIKGRKNFHTMSFSTKFDLSTVVVLFDLM